MKKIKKIVIFVFFLYALITIINQQKVLISYKNTQKEVEKQVEVAEDYSKKLSSDKENINSNEYIEKIARERLNMYYPNERIYVDNNQ